jgi:hypothetical protein
LYFDIDAGGRFICGHLAGVSQIHSAWKTGKAISDLYLLLNDFLKSSSRIVDKFDELETEMMVPMRLFKHVCYCHGVNGVVYPFIVLLRHVKFHVFLARALIFHFRLQRAWYVKTVK